MSDSVTIKNLSEVLSGLTKYEDKLIQAAVYGLSQVAFAIEREAKKNIQGRHPRGQGHIPGTGPGPNNMTGALRRSIHTEIKQGFGNYVASVFPTMEYSRAVELGNPRWKSGVKYPYLMPAKDSVTPKANQIFTNAVVRKMRG